MKEVKASNVYCQSEATYEEAQVEKRVEAALKTEDAKLKTSWSSTLFDISALPFKLADLPSTHGMRMQGIRCQSVVILIHLLCCLEAPPL